MDIRKIKSFESQQSRFKQNHSGIDLKSDIQEPVVTKQYIIAVYFDLNKAFLTSAGFRKGYSTIDHLQAIR